MIAGVLMRDTRDSEKIVSKLKRRRENEKRKNIEERWKSFTSSRRENSVKLRLRSVLKGKNRTDSVKHKKSTANASKMRQKA